MSNNQIYPLAVAYGFNSSSGVTFLLPGREVTIEGANEILPVILPLCNGYRDIEEIVSIGASKSGYEKEDVQQLVQTLLEREILIDVHHYYQFFHEVSANPMPFWHDLPEEVMTEMVKGKSPLVYLSHTPQNSLAALLEARESIREFSGEALSKSEILKLGWVIYGKQKRSTSFPESTIGLGTIPSAGALYPLRLFAIVLKEHPSIEEGIYLFNPEGISQIAPIDPETLENIFGGYSTPLDSTAVIFALVCEFQQITQKYSNRGYRYALIEAGHAAQNAYLWCAEQGLGIVEVCGFNDEALAKALLIPYPEQAPLTTMFIGRRLL